MQTTALRMPEPERIDRFKVGDHVVTRDLLTRGIVVQVWHHPDGEARYSVEYQLWPNEPAQSLWVRESHLHDLAKGLQEMDRVGKAVRERIDADRAQKRRQAAAAAEPMERPE